MEEQLIYDRIDRYLSGQMTPEEGQAFEAEVKADPTLAAEVVLQTQARHAARASAKDALKAQLMQELKDIKPAAPVRQHPFTRVHMVAAAVIILLIVGPLLYQALQPDKMSGEELYAEVFDPQITATRGDTSSTSISLQQALAPATQGDFAASISRLERLVADTAFTQKSKAYLSLGITYLQAEQPEKALESFQKVGVKSYYYSEANWYTALAYMKLGDRGNAYFTLKDIEMVQSHPYQQQAAYVLKRMK